MRPATAGPRLAMFLSGGAVVTAMARVLQDGGGRDLADRLLEALEAGRDAGGPSHRRRHALAERSAARIVRGAESDLARDLDLRVDAHHDAVAELRRVYQTYAPYMEYYALRARDPQNTPAPDVWEKTQKIAFWVTAAGNPWAVFNEISSPPETARLLRNFDRPSIMIMKFESSPAGYGDARSCDISRWPIPCRRDI